MIEELNELIVTALNRNITLEDFSNAFEDAMINAENKDISLDQNYYEVLHAIALYDVNHTGENLLYGDAEFYQKLYSIFHGN